MSQQQPMRVIALDEPTADDAAQTAIVGTARLAMWVGVSYFASAAAVATMDLVQASPTGQYAVAGGRLIFPAIQFVGGFLMALGGQCVYRRSSAARRLLIFGASIVLIGRPLGSLIPFAFFVAHARAVSNIVFAQFAISWIQLALILIPAMAVLLLAAGKATRDVVSPAGPNEYAPPPFQELAERFSAVPVAYATLADRGGELAVRHITTVMVALTAAFGVLAAISRAVSQLPVVQQLYRGLPKSYRALGYCGMGAEAATVIMLLTAGAAYGLRFRFRTLLIVGCLIAVIARCLSGVHSACVYSASTLPPSILHYYLASILASSLLFSLLPLASLIWFTRPTVRELAAARSGSPI